jgi:hypothetical protein
VWLVIEVIASPRPAGGLGCRRRPGGDSGKVMRQSSGSGAHQQARHRIIVG